MTYVSVEQVPPNDLEAAVTFYRERKAQGGPEPWEVEVLLHGMADQDALLDALDALDAAG